MTVAAPPTTDPNTYPRIAIKASAVTGANVLNLRGEDVGNVEEVVIDVERGKIAYLVLSFGGFLGMGGKHYAIPWKRLKFDSSKNAYILNVSREQIESAPDFDKGTATQLSDDAWKRRLHEYFDSLPPFLI